MADKTIVALILSIIFITNESYQSYWNCNGSQSCYKQSMQCTPNEECIIDCNGTNGGQSCKEATIDASSSTDVIVYCRQHQDCEDIEIKCGNGDCNILCSGNGDQQCKKLSLTCGSGRCGITCNGQDSCSDSNINVGSASSFECQGDCNSQYPSPFIQPTSMPTSYPTLQQINSSTIDTQTVSTTNPVDDSTTIPTGDPTQLITNTPSSDPTTVATNGPTIHPTSAPTMNPSQNPTIYPSEHASDLSNNPNVSPTSNIESNDVTTVSSTTTYRNIDTMVSQYKILPNWIKKGGDNCADGMTDLEYDNEYRGEYCEACADNHAGINGICSECGTLKTPNHTKTDCVYHQPWWLWLIQTIIGLIFFLFIGLCTQMWVKKKSKTEQSKITKHQQNNEQAKSDAINDGKNELTPKSPLIQNLESQNNIMAT